MTNEEINKAVCEQVMGECWHEQLEGTQWCVCQENYQGHKSHYSNCKNTPYSTSWEAMRLVVERMRELGYLFYISTDDNQWQVKLQDANKDHYYTKTHHYESLPKAVCLAALEAVKGEK